MGQEGVSEMVERVARAISGAPFPSAASYRKARAAIEAMREPSKEMVKASLPEAWIGHPEASDATIERYWTGHRRASEKKWRAMIDAALAEDKASNVP